MQDAVGQDQLDMRRGGPARRPIVQLEARCVGQEIRFPHVLARTHRDERRAALEKHILVGTSTVDIGVDFRINYLIFEAYNAGSFLQRFGRLGDLNNGATHGCINATTTEPSGPTGAGCATQTWGS